MCDPLWANPAWPPIVWEANSEGMKNRWDSASGVLIHGCIGIHEGGGSGAHCSSVTAPLPSSSSQSTNACSLLWQSPLTHPHLLVPMPDIVVLSQPRLLNTKTRFSSMSPIVFVLALGIWGGVVDADNTQNINTSIHPCTNWGGHHYSISVTVFVLINDAAAHSRLRLVSSFFKTSASAREINLLSSWGCSSW